MIYIKCPSCGYLIGNRQIIYEKELDKIYSNPNTDEQTKLNLKNKLIESLEIQNYCCKMRVISYIQLPNIVK